MLCEGRPGGKALILPYNAAEGLAARCSFLAQAAARPAAARRPYLGKIRMNRDPSHDVDELHSFPEEQAPSAADIAQPVGIEELVQQIKDTADKLLRDKASRGDVKLLSTA